jgi:hypothetical protein
MAPVWKRMSIDIEFTHGWKRVERRKCVMHTQQDEVFESMLS